jgi:hypothetical protein
LDFEISLNFGLSAIAQSDGGPLYFEFSRSTLQRFNDLTIAPSHLSFALAFPPPRGMLSG